MTAAQARLGDRPPRWRENPRVTDPLPAFASVPSGASVTVRALLCVPAGLPDCPRPDGRRGGRTAGEKGCARPCRPLAACQGPSVCFHLRRGPGALPLPGRAVATRECFSSASAAGGGGAVTCQHAGPWRGAQRAPGAGCEEHPAPGAAPLPPLFMAACVGRVWTGAGPRSQMEVRMPTPQSRCSCVPRGRAGPWGHPLWLPRPSLDADTPTQADPE